MRSHVHSDDLKTVQWDTNVHQQTDRPSADFNILKPLFSFIGGITIKCIHLYAVYTCLYQKQDLEVTKDSMYMYKKNQW